MMHQPITLTTSFRSGDWPTRDALTWPTCNRFAWPAMAQRRGLSHNGSDESVIPRVWPKTWNQTFAPPFRAKGTPGDWEETPLLCMSLLLSRG